MIRFVFLVLISLPALAAPSPTPFVPAPQFTLSVQDHSLSFYRLPQSHLIATEKCLASKPCAAKTAAKKATSAGLNLARGANPGAIICQQIGGTLIQGLDAKRNQYSLCAFPDGSQLTCGSLYSEAIENDLSSP